jgi:hypothetical protein
MIEFLYILAAFVVFAVVATVVWQMRMRKHHGVSREQFIAAFADTAIPAEIPATVYDYYKGLVIFKEFSVAPDDSYEGVFREGQEDIDGDAEHLVRKLGMELPIEPILREWEDPVKTLRDMVLWLNWIRQQQGGQKAAADSAILQDPAGASPNETSGKASIS